MALVERAIPVGGAALNFAVVGGTTEPTNPKENTIWVNTENEITSWVFSSTEPTPDEGLVWITAAATSPVAFNATKKNTLMVYPSKPIQQYVSGAWIEKTSLIYQSGAWKSFNMVLYESGNTNNSVTGGYQAGAWGGYGTHNGSVAPTLTLNNDSMLVAHVDRASCAGAVTTVNKIDLTGWNTLSIAGHQQLSGQYSTEWAFARIGFVSTLADQLTFAAETTIYGANIDFDTTVNVSNLEGEYYFCIRISTFAEGAGTTELTLTKATLE